MLNKNIKELILNEIEAQNNFIERKIDFLFTVAGFQSDYKNGRSVITLVNPQFNESIIYEDNEIIISFIRNIISTIEYEFLLSIKLLPNCNKILTEEDYDFLLSLNIPFFKNYQCKYCVHWIKNFKELCLKDMIKEINSEINSKSLINDFSLYHIREKSPKVFKKYDKKYKDKIKNILGSNKVLLKSFSRGSFSSIGIDSISMVEYIFNPLYTNIINLRRNVENPNTIFTDNVFSIYDKNKEVISKNNAKNKYSHVFDKEILLHAINNGKGSDIKKTIYLGYSNTGLSFNNENQSVMYRTISNSFNSSISKLFSVMKVEKELLKI